MTDRVFNFSPGPAMFPLPVLEQARDEMLSLPGLGMSVLEISHRSKPFLEIIQAAEENLRRLLGVPDSYRILFLQGGSRLQFSMTAMNLLRGTGQKADYILTGSWGKKAVVEASREGAVHTAWDGGETNYDRLPKEAELRLSTDAAYVHFTSNETIQGVQFSAEPDVGEVPLVCDASSDFLSRPIDIERYGLIYACAQKNAGPAGVTVVIVRDDLVERSDDSLPGYLNYKNHVQAESMYNTPPTFAIYLLNLVTRWILHEIGGLEKMATINCEKAALLYDLIDDSHGFYQGHAQADSRSQMNVVFRLSSEEQTKRFLAGAESIDLYSLKGHRSVGGIRASIYNAMPREGVETLARFMKEFMI